MGYRWQCQAGQGIFGLWRLMLHATKLRLPNFYNCKIDRRTSKIDRRISVHIMKNRLPPTSYEYMVHHTPGSGMVLESRYSRPRVQTPAAAIANKQQLLVPAERRSSAAGLWGPHSGTRHKGRGKSQRDHDMMPPRPARVTGRAGAAARGRTYMWIARAHSSRPICGRYMYGRPPLR